MSQIVPFDLRTEQVFAEGAGIALVNSAQLSAFIARHGLGKNVLAAFTSSEFGNRACGEGIVVPIIGLSHGYYSVSVRNSGASFAAHAVKSSSGWLFNSDGTSSVLCGLGYLTNWDPESPRHHPVAVPRDAYSVTFSAGKLSNGEWGIDFRLERGGQRFSADLSEAFDCYLDEI